MDTSWTWVWSLPASATVICGHFLQNRMDRASVCTFIQADTNADSVLVWNNYGTIDPSYRVPKWLDHPVTVDVSLYLILCCSSISLWLCWALVTCMRLLYVAQKQIQTNLPTASISVYWNTLCSLEYEVLAEVIQNTLNCGVCYSPDCCALATYRIFCGAICQMRMQCLLNEMPYLAVCCRILFKIPKSWSGHGSLPKFNGNFLVQR